MSTPNRTRVHNILLTERIAAYRKIPNPIYSAYIHMHTHTETEQISLSEQRATSHETTRRMLCLCLCECVCTCTRARQNAHTTHICCCVFTVHNQHTKKHIHTQQHMYGATHICWHRAQRIICENERMFPPLSPMLLKARARELAEQHARILRMRSRERHTGAPALGLRSFKNV